jgi:hypothetical protein
MLKNIKNINQPTDPFWGKVIAASALAGATIVSFATLMHVAWLQWGALILTLVGTVGPLFVPKKGNDGGTA